VIPKSIRWRLQLWYGVVFLALLAGFGVTSFALLRNEQMRRVDEEFQRRLGPLSNFMHPPPGGRGPGGPRLGRGGRRGEQRGGGDRGDFGGDFPNDGPPPEDQRFPPPGEQGVPFRLPSQQASMFGSESNSFYYIVWGPDGKIVAHSEAAPSGVPIPMDANPGRNPPELRMRGIYREIFHPAPGGEMVLVGRSIADELASLRLLAWELAGAGGVVLLLGLTGGWWVASRAIRPIEDISATAVKIAAGDLAQRISAGDTDSELGKLASVLNSTFARLEAAFAQQKQFTSDAAHELRTPLTVMLTQTQTTLNRDRNATEYRATVEACQRTAQRMRKLMESLLELARLDAGQETMKRTPFDLSRTVSDCVAMVTPLAEERRLKIHCALPPLPCIGDSERLAQVITNLLSNAIEYNQESGEVRISGEPQDGTVAVRVNNTGPGIAAADLPRIFERFYRADPSRTGAGAHTGLGLAISKAIVEAHGGTIEATSEPSAGTTFTVRLPARTSG
jgi:heavy metal sensor kinase